MTVRAATRKRTGTRFGKFPKVPFLKKLAIALAMATIPLFVWIMEPYFPFFIRLGIGVIAAFGPTALYWLYIRFRKYVLSKVMSPGFFYFTWYAILIDQGIFGGIMYFSNIRLNAIQYFANLMLQQGYSGAIIVAIQTIVGFGTWFLVPILWTYDMYDRPPRSEA